MEFKIIDRSGYLNKVRDILLQKTQPPTLEEVLAAEERRLGVKLEVRTQKEDK